MYATLATSGEDKLDGTLEIEVFFSKDTNGRLWKSSVRQQSTNHNEKSELHRYYTVSILWQL